MQQQKYWRWFASAYCELRDKSRSTLGCIWIDFIYTMRTKFVQEIKHLCIWAAQTSHATLMWVHSFFNFPSDSLKLLCLLLFLYTICFGAVLSHLPFYSKSLYDLPHVGLGLGKKNIFWNRMQSVQKYCIKLCLFLSKLRPKGSILQLKRNRIAKTMIVLCHWSNKEIAPPQTHIIGWANVAVVGPVVMFKQSQSNTIQGNQALSQTGTFNINFLQNITHRADITVILLKLYGCKIVKASRDLCNLILSPIILSSQNSSLHIPFLCHLPLLYSLVCSKHTQ